MSSCAFQGKLAAASILLLAIISSCHGHGALVRPRARGTLKCQLGIPGLNLKVPTDYCVHCLNSGGPGTIGREGKWRPYDPLSKTAPFRRGFGLCGDNIKDAVPRNHEKNGIFGPPAEMPYAEVYKSGQVVEFIMDVKTSHTGLFEFFICDVGKCGGDISEKCFKEGHCHRLLRAPAPDCDKGDSMNCAPIDEKYPGRWYNPCKTNKQEQFYGGKFMRYQLPKNFECSDCVIQMYWMAGQSCSPPGMLEFFDRNPMHAWKKCQGDGGSIGGRSPHLKTCGSGEHGPVPEEFWNCADVRVMGKTVGPPKIMPPAAALMELPVDALITPKDIHTPSPSPTSDGNGKDDPRKRREVSPPKNNAPEQEAPKMTVHPTKTPMPMSNDDKDDHGPPHAETKKSLYSNSPVKTHERKDLSPSTTANTDVEGKSDTAQESLDMGPVTITVPALDGELTPRSDNSQSMRHRSAKRNLPESKGAGCVTEWGQCGGIGYKGPTDCCSKQLECIKLNPYYAQCKAPERPRNYAPVK